MKKYIEPLIRIKQFYAESILTTSNARMLKTNVGNVEGENYGSKSASDILE